MRRARFAVPVARFATALLSQQEVGPRAEAIADQVSELLPGVAVIVYVIEKQDDPTWLGRAVAGEVAAAHVMKLSAGGLGALLESKSFLQFEGADVRREEYAHLDVRRTVTGLAYAPLLAHDVLHGAIEVVNFEPAFPDGIAEMLGEISELAGPAIASALLYESERNTSLHSISRVTQMYDLEKVFNSTLEMDQLLNIIAAKFQDVMNVEAVNLWMVNSDVLELVACAGSDPTVQLGAVQRPGDGVAGDVSDNGETILIDDPDDQRLCKRNGDQKQGTVFALLAVPLIEHESLVGVVEAINRFDGRPFDEDDQFFLTSICETASNALHNASLLQAERKVEILEALVKVSVEITSTLDLDHVLDAIVNGPATVIPYERAAIALEQRGRLQIKAISGVPKINPEDPETIRLIDMLAWASLTGEPVFVAQRGDTIDAYRPETRAKFEAYFEKSGMHALHAIPLVDDDGRLGIISFESSDPDFLTTAHMEMIKVLAGQATVALRNASLYREVPFIEVLKPILEKKRRFLALQKHRRLAIAAGAALLLLFLVAFPLPLRVEGSAVVAPARSARIQPEIAGVVQTVDVREGDAVKKGTILATLADWQYRSELAAAEARYEAAASEMNRALATNDGGEAGVARVQADYWSSEVARARERIERTSLRSPIDGVVATPRIENAVGRNLSPGDTLAEVLDTSQASVDVAIDEDDIPRIRPGDKAYVKLEGFPVRTFRGHVTVVSPKAEVRGDDRIFFARVNVANPDGSVRAGMQGRSKILTGWRPAGEVLFRHPAMWLWSKIWAWFGW
jgi:RND family efflux transporter MFP subunit